MLESVKGEGFSIRFIAKTKKLLCTGHARYGLTSVIARKPVFLACFDRMPSE